LSASARRRRRTFGRDLLGEMAGAQARSAERTTVPSAVRSSRVPLSRTNTVAWSQAAGRAMFCSPRPKSQ